ncbi:glycosyltransferase family 4 protein [Galbibacter mesophilus]|uniref:glycosyltransferase family 4 protein n=1 Tax=Galbibacter mesophilus TaxID=379069 RepID=UPI00192039A7|nr:glycosyltransferase family 4 protein [Galbibacter mesophilus]MCM5663527.1 glycosyltransferase family 4 protein [Galbibacter mesophilus]
MKKVLIITYYWPPAGGPGVQRWLNFVKFLPEFEIEPIVFIPENPDYPMEDASFLEEVPKNARILKHPIFEPYKLASFFSKKKTKQISKGIISSEKQSVVESIMLWIRGNFFIPDARVFWVKPSVKYLESFIQKEQIDTIITTGPPHSVHLIGMKLKGMLDLKWIADFRDPWTNIGYHSDLKLTESSQKKHLALERQVLNKANQVITTSYTTKEEFSGITEKPIEVITNGFLSENEGQKELSKNFTLSHIGSLLSGRNPEVLWNAIGELLEELDGFKKDFELQLAGAVSEDVLRSIKAAGITDNLSVLGYVSHEEALHLQKSSQVLLLIEIDSEKTRGIIPGKLFEYLSAKRPIVAIGPNGWDVQKILEETKAGVYFEYSEKENIKETIRSYYKAFKNANLHVNSVNIEKFHRRALTAHLASIM